MRREYIQLWLVNHGSMSAHSDSLMVGICFLSTRNPAILRSGVLPAIHPVVMHSGDQLPLHIQPVFHRLLSLQWHSDFHPAIKEVNRANSGASVNSWWNDALNSTAQLVLAPTASRNHNLRQSAAGLAYEKQLLLRILTFGRLVLLCNLPQAAQQ